MKILATLLSLAVAVSSGTASSKAPLTDLIEPPEAIRLTTEFGPDQGLPGIFLVTVKATGTDGTRFYLNSEPNYREPTNLTIAIDKSAIRWLKKKYGPDLGAQFKGKTIQVSGIARRVPIYLVIPGEKPKMTNGKPPAPLYFQTHVLVYKSDQIKIAD